MKKRVLAMLLSAVMAISLLAGCGGDASSAPVGDSTSSGSEAAKNNAAADSVGGGTNGEKTKLRALFIAHPLTKDVEEMQWLAEMEEEANVEIEWEVIRADWETVKSTSIIQFK